MRSPCAILLLSSLLLFGCKTPDTGPGGAPQLTSQELTIAEQELTDFKVRFEGQVTSPTQATLEKASYELVVDGKPVKKGEQKLEVPVPAGGSASFTVEQGSQYVASADDLKSLSARGGDILAAIRGQLTVKQGDGTLTLDYAKSRLIRVPRLPSVEMHEMDFARYAADEVSGTFYIGVKNPNPFPIRLEALTYADKIGEKAIGQGDLGRGEQVGAAATGVFELPASMNRETYGPEVEQLIKTRTLPYDIQGKVKGKLFEVPFDLKGDIKLNESK